MIAHWVLEQAVTSSQPLNFLFKITKRSPTERSKFCRGYDKLMSFVIESGFQAVPTDILRLVLKYRLIDDGELPFQRPNDVDILTGPNRA
jgi:hypothetical protein